ncbi:hypothetical protein V8G54_032564 [Vigna mungo]|uniref:Uncharacterized protein n=1 Tax=Vigna mungo TaxID=3915 RepID=A0AAQ3RGT4_VIGMU
MMSVSTYTRTFIKRRWSLLTRSPNLMSVMTMLLMLVNPTRMWARSRLLLVQSLLLSPWMLQEKPVYLKIVRNYILYVIRLRIQLAQDRSESRYSFTLFSSNGARKRH